MNSQDLRRHRRRLGVATIEMCLGALLLAAAAICVTVTWSPPPARLDVEYGVTESP